MLTSLGRAVHWKSKVVACCLIDKIQNKAHSTFYLNKKPHSAIIGPHIQTVIYALFSFSFYAWQSKEHPRETYEQTLNEQFATVLLFRSCFDLHGPNSLWEFKVWLFVNMATPTWQEVSQGGRNSKFQHRHHLSNVPQVISIQFLAELYQDKAAWIALSFPKDGHQHFWTELVQTSNVADMTPVS